MNKNQRNTFKPYLINAFYTWTMDIGFTPLIEINYSSKNIIPQILKEKETIVFNIHPSSINNLVFGKDSIEFEARFSSTPHNISIYHESIKKIFSKEDGYGLEFNLFDEVNKNESSNLSENLRPIKQKGHLILIKNDN